MRACKNNHVVLTNLILSFWNNVWKYTLVYSPHPHLYLSLSASLPSPLWCLIAGCVHHPHGDCSWRDLVIVGGIDRKCDGTGFGWARRPKYGNRASLERHPLLLMERAHVGWVACAHSLNLTDAVSRNGEREPLSRVWHTVARSINDLDCNVGEVVSVSVDRSSVCNGL